MPTVSIIQAIKTFIATYSGLQAGSPIYVDHLGTDPIEYSIVPLPGDPVLSTSVGGGSEDKQFPFAFQVSMDTESDPDRLKNSEFFEAFRDWMHTQSLAGVYPVISDKKVPYSIEAIGASFILEEGESGTAVYQIVCNLLYDQYP